MSNPTTVFLVRFKSRLSYEEATRIMEDRAPRFRALRGLKQKHYMLDPATGEFAGLYLWDSPESFQEYRESELRATIAQAYQVEGEPRLEVYKVIKTLRD